MNLRLYFPLLALLMSAPAPCYAQAAQPATSITATVDSARLIGSWTLVSEGHFDPSGRYTPVGDHMSGQLIYASDGSMSVLITIVPRPATLNDVIAYSGTFSIEGNKILHHIKISSQPASVNSTATRLAFFRGEDLVLASVPNADRKSVV